MTSIFARRGAVADTTAEPAPVPEAQAADLLVGPGLIPLGAGHAPVAPTSTSDAGYDVDVLAALVLKTAYSMTKFTAAEIAKRMCLSSALVSVLLDQHRRDKLVEILGEAGQFDFRYVMTGLGHERAQRAFDVSGYVGPAPVSVERYAEVLQWQVDHFPPVSADAVRAAVRDLVLPDDVIEVAGLACASARSLFVFGPAGTGKTTVGHLLHGALAGDLWIPHCIGIGNSIVRIYDPQLHETRQTPETPDPALRVDRRWACIRRPFLVAGGELTLDALELSYSTAHRYYEAPLHLKANGGIFLLADLGYQRAAPLDLLSRWIFPLERRVDYLTLSTGQKLTVPFLLMLILSTNLEPEKVMNAAFLRRMGYRLHLDHPEPEAYRTIFTRYAEARGATVPPGMIEALFARYEAEQRPLRSCEPRDLIERARDICGYQGRGFELTMDVVDRAWRGYFGSRLATEE